MIDDARSRDRVGRDLGTLRISVTDRCNLRCVYCMPEEEYVWLHRDDLLTFDEIVALADAFLDAGVRKVRLTGGEPLARPRLSDLVARLARRAHLRDLSLTTNGVLLAGEAEALRDAGLGRLTVSLDTLRVDRFAKLTGRDALPDVLRGIDAARAAGFTRLKIDSVVLRGVNDDEIPALVSFARDVGAEIRFIEYMDVGGATRWAPSLVVSRAEILAAIEAAFGVAQPLAGRGADPAERFQLPDGTTFGIIASTTAPFCGACDRARLTADGVLYTCLYAQRGVDLRGPSEAARRSRSSPRASRACGASARIAARRGA